MKKENKKKKISLIVPCYNEEAGLKIFYQEFSNLKKEMNYVNWELIFVDDGSKDDTLKVLKKLSINNEVHYISFSKNFGKEYAMIAGFDASTGDYVATIDADLQHPLSLLKEMFDLVDSGKCDCAAARSKKRNYSFLRKSLTNIYYKLINSISDVEMRSNATDYRLMNRKMLNAILEIREHNRYLKGIYEIVGFKTVWLEFTDHERVAGESKFNITKLFKYAITGIISFSQFPLILLTILGIIFLIITLILLIVILILKLCMINVNYLFFLIIIGILFLSSIVLISNGILGLYIAQIQTESKNRPLYIIKETNIK